MIGRRVGVKHEESRVFVGVVATPAGILTALGLEPQTY
jgi:hypothetical protein